MKTLWQRIRDWYEKNVPTESFKFYPPATNSQIEEAQQTIGLNFPIDLVNSLQTHGMFLNVAIGGYGYTLLSPGEMVQQHEFWRKAADDDKQCCWNFAWIALSESGGGGYDVLDSKTGEILDFHIEQDEPDVVAASYRTWIETYANDLEAGKYRFDPVEEWLIPVGDG